MAKIPAEIGKLLGDGKISDFKFIVSNKEFPVLKTIAGKNYKIYRQLYFILPMKLFLARSQKLDEIMKKSTGGIAVIKQIQPEVFSKVLEYIYTDHVKAIDEHVDSLLDAASYCQLIGLKTLCENVILKQLFFGRDATDVFQIAHRNKCSWKLKSNAFEIIRK